MGDARQRVVFLPNRSFFSLISMKFSIKIQQDIALFFLRLVLGAIFLYAGYAKWFVWSASPERMSSNMVLLIKFLSIVEPLGGAALLVGFLTRWASAGLAIIMAGSLYFVQMMGVGFFTSMQGTGMDYNVLILAGCLVLAAFGGGKFSVDIVWKK